jgi:hypothetical protein
MKSLITVPSRMMPSGVKVIPGGMSHVLEAINKRELNRECWCFCSNLTRFEMKLLPFKCDLKLGNNFGS